jgi:predicted DsbA family dithiol-disulfide isomerase
MAQVATLLKASADFEIVPYYDGHGAYETQQNQIQLCIQKLAKDKYWSYAAKFVSDVYTKCSSVKTEDCDKTESIKVMKAVGIDSTKIMSCVSTDGVALASAASAKAQKAGVSGSPTVTINGVISSAARSAEAYKSAVCSAFNTAPSACSSTLSSSAAAAAGNC